MAIYKALNGLMLSLQFNIRGRSTPGFLLLLPATMHVYITKSFVLTYCLHRGSPMYKACCWLTFPLVSCQYLFRNGFKIKVLFLSAEALSCSKKQLEQCGEHATCIADPYLPDHPVCRCVKGFKVSKENKCAGE